MPTIAPPNLVNGAVRQPLPYGLFSTFLPRSGTGDRWEAGVTWEHDARTAVDGLGVFQCSASETAVQTVDFGGTGLTSFTLTYDTETTSSINTGANAAAVQTALEALPNLVPGDIVVTGGPVPADIVVTFAQTVTDPPLLTGTATGGDSTVTVTGAADGGWTNNTLGLPKSLDPNTPEPGSALPFVVYGHFQCSPLAWSPQDAQAKASAHLQAHEEARVEQALWTGNLGNRPRFLGAADLGSGTSYGLARGLAMMEDYIAFAYGSLGVIHMTRGVALRMIADDLLTAMSGRLFTALGTPVAAGAGYPGTGPNNETVTLDESWIFATPPLFGYRGEVFTSSNRQGDLLDRGTNDLYAIAERSYLIGFDPVTLGAVEIDLTT